MSIKGEVFTAEKTFSQLVVLSFKIRSKWPSRTALVFLFTALLVNSFCLEDDVTVILKSTRQWADIGLSFAISTLGFLIAGYAIFATVSKPRMMIAMMGHIHKETGLPTAKYLHLTFIRVFAHFLAIVFIFIAIVLLGSAGGFIGNVIAHFPSSQVVTPILVNLAYGIVGVSILNMAFLLRIFIFNIYTVVMIMLRWEYEASDE